MACIICMPEFEANFTASLSRPRIQNVPKKNGTHRLRKFGEMLLIKTLGQALSLAEERYLARTKLAVDHEEYISANTCASYKAMTNKIRAMFPVRALKKRLDKFSTKELRRLVGPIRSKMSASSYNILCVVLRCAFNFAHGTKEMCDTAASGLEYQTPKKKAEMTETELISLQNHMKEQAKKLRVKAE
jgi:site-specific recombinase XerD